MPLFLGHTTAERILDRLDFLPEPAMGQKLEHCWASRHELSQLDLSFLEGIPAPIDVIVSSRDELRKWSGIRCHLSVGSIPDDSFFEIAPDVFVATPELCLVQQAQHLSLAQTIVFGERLCGTYALDDSRASGIRERKPLTTSDDLRSYARCCFKARGTKRVRRACDLMLEGSASPMESITRLVFCLPTRLGGFGLPSPLMNYEKALSPSAQALTGTSFVRIDLFWKDHDFGGEYQGKYSHSSYDDIGADIARQLAAELMGIELQMLTIEQIRNQAQRVTVARKIADRLGTTIPTDSAFLRANQRLVDDLLQKPVAY